MVSNLTLPVHQPGAVAVTHGCESGVAQMQSCMADDVVYKSSSSKFIRDDYSPWTALDVV